MIPLPWSDESAPNVMLEITTACNLTCTACYANRGNGFKSLDHIREELKQARALRPVDTITLTGGEPLLHPKLTDIIRLISSKGLRVFLLSNGLRATAEKLNELKAAGLDDILFHVDFGQQRKDLPESPILTDILQRQHELMHLARQGGVDPSLSFTLYDETPEATHQLLDRFLQQEPGTMLFLAEAKDPMKPEPFDPSRWQQISGLLKQHYGLEPFACIPSTEKGAPPVWYSYFIPIRMENDRIRVYPYKGTVADRLLIGLGKMIKGQYTHRMPKSERLVKFRILTNGLVRFQLRQAIRFLRTSSSASFQHKVIVYDAGPYIGPSGKTVRCTYCPTAIVQNGSLVPCCELQLAPEPSA